MSATIKRETEIAAQPGVLTMSVVVLVIVLGSLVTSDDALAQTAGDASRGEPLFAVCAVCHGALGQGRQQRDAPKLNGREDWYLIRQMKNFTLGIRGTHDEDIPGMQMQVTASMLLDEATVNDIAAYLSTLPDGSPPATVDDDLRPHRWDSNFAIIEPGDSVGGKRNYALCVGCHGLEAEGMRLLNGPRLSGRYNWYLVRQLKYLKYGVRGTHQRDNIGRIMASAVGVLANDQAIYDVVAYIQTLPNGRD